MEVRASFDFDEYDVREAVVHISYGYKGEKGDRSKRVHEHSLTLDKNNLSDKIKFFVDDHGTLTYDYQVEFIHNTGSIIGSPETKVTSQLFEDEIRRDLSINMDTHSPLIPVRDFKRENCNSAMKAYVRSKSFWLLPKMPMAVQQS